MDPHHLDRSGGMGTRCDDTKIAPVCRKAHEAIGRGRPDEMCDRYWERLSALGDTSAFSTVLWRSAVVCLTEYLRRNDGRME